MSNTSKSTEDIVKLIDHVSYKKTEGKLYLMAERLAWMTNTSDVFKISEHYKNIRAQRISPDDKDKVQLQLLMHSGSSFTFHFIHPDGRSKQISDRNSVKISLQYFIPRFKEKAQSELETKRKLCENNPQILDLYRELVTNKYLCKEEFWQRTESNINQQSLVNEYSLYSRGIPSWLLATPPQKDGKSQCNLSRQMVEDIFSVYPAVKQKHAQLVPNEMSEEEFWNKFFQSHYFHRFKSDLSNDKFGSCAYYDIQQMEKEAQRLKKESLTLICDKTQDVGEFCVEEETGKGVNHEAHKQTVSSSEELLRRFNRQSFLILKTMKSKDNLKRPHEADYVDLDATNEKKRMIDSSSEMYSEEERFVMEKAPINRIFGVNFNTEKVSQYINKISLSSVSNTIGPIGDRKRMKQFMDDQMRKLNLLKHNLSNTQTRPLVNLMSSSVATDVLTDIGHLYSDADVAISSFSQQGRNIGKVPPEMIRDIKTLYRVSSELFRHFWECFPIIDSNGFEKLHRMVDAIKKFRSQKIDNFIQQHPNYTSLTGAVDSKPIDHLCKMTERINDAYERYMNNYKQINKSIL